MGVRVPSGDNVHNPGIRSVGCRQNAIMGSTSLKIAVVSNQPTNSASLALGQSQTSISIKSSERYDRMLCTGLT